MWLRLVQLVFITATVNSKLDVDSVVRTARCRANCVYKVAMPDATEAICQKTSNCSQCWNTCYQLQALGYSESICGLQNCGAGCLSACQWWSDQQRTRSTTDSSSWSRGPVIIQDLERNLVVQAKTVVQELGLDDAIRLAESLNTSVNPSWRVALVSLYHQPELVSAEIRWKTDLRKHKSADRRKPSEHCIPVFLVTWSVEGGVVRGNLVTNSSTAVLSLWPDTVYRIQVTSLSCRTAGRQSVPALVDTRRAAERLGTHEGSVPRPEVPHGSISRTGVPQGSVLGGTAAAAALFLALALAFTWRARHRLGLPHSKLVDEDACTPNIYRVFPPAVRLVTESKFKQEIFSSTDNLLQAVNFEK